MDLGRSLKRRKTQLACEHCRTKKIKCDGVHPICGGCARRDWGSDKCIWKHVDGREENATESIVHELRQKIRELERQSGAQAPRASPHRTQWASQIEGARHTTTLSAFREVEPTNSIVSALEAAVTGELQDEGFVGSSSAAAFMTLIRKAVDPKSPGSLRIAAGKRRGMSPPSNSFSEPYVLPPRKVADALVALFWEYVHPLYPFLNKASFNRIYKSIWTGQAIVDHPSPLMRTTEKDNVSLVNLVLALGCQYSKDSEEDAARIAEEYFTRARTAYRYDFIDSGVPSLQQVQVMLLMAQHLKGTGSTHKAWGVMGAAIRMCQQLGLHLPTTSCADAFANPIDRELIKRVWHGCLMIERMLCMNLGRPAMVPATCRHAVPLPFEIDEQAYHSDTLLEALVEREGIISARNGGATIISFFVLSAELYEIVQDMLLSLYAEGNPNDHLQEYDCYFTGPSSVFEIDKKLAMWHAKIPHVLRFHHGSATTGAQAESDRTFQRQGIVLRLRYLQARIYLLRPVFAQVVTIYRLQNSTADVQSRDNPLGTRLNDRIGRQCAVSCVGSSIELIEVTKNQLTTTDSWGQKPSWLYSVLHVYLAATVLIAARLAPIITASEIPEVQIRTSWQNALDILRGFQTDNASAQRCVAALEILYCKLPKNSDHDCCQSAFESSNGTNHVSQTQNLELSSGYNDFELDLGTDLNGILEESSTWLSEFDLLDPKDMSWFNVVPDIAFPYS